MSLSPLIAKGQLSLNAKGDLVTALDIETQATVTVSAYACIYNYAINSGLIPFLNNSNNDNRISGNNINTVTNIVKSAYQILIQNGIITNLNIAPFFITANNLNININMQDEVGQPLKLSWNNNQ